MMAKLHSTTLSTETFVMKRRKQPGAKGSVQLIWWGHSAFEAISPNGTVVLFDPWLENPLAPAGTKEIPKVDLILVSHGHSDHLGNTIEIAKRTNAVVATMYEVYKYLQTAGVTTAQGMNKGGSVTVEGITVTMVDARHSSAIEVNGAMIPGGEAAGFIVEFENGTTLYHAGDTSFFLDMKFIGEFYKPDIALLPIGDLYTMGPREAAKAASVLHATTIVGMHYATFPPLTGTPEALRKFLPASQRKRVHILQPGIAMTI
jgi:L-ascorbate metabolism protein UlaG (beta-lactamase superfamily)